LGKVTINEKNKMADEAIVACFKAFGYMYRGGVRPKPLNMRYCDRLTNAQFAKEDDLFRRSCAAAGIPPTARQVSKWRMHRGEAFRCRGRA
jgi:hypothetical protein